MDDAIRQQVDYYFSSENLTADRFLLSKMKGSKNKPIPLYVIHGFKKMRDYQPLLAVAKALLLSSNVNVYKEGDTWYVQRKEPFQKDGAKDQDSQAPPKKPKKASNDDTFIEGPMSAEDADHEKLLYDPEVASIEERLGLALGRYQTKRKFGSENKNIFEKWLKFGGVDASPKPFSGGFSPEDMEGLSAAQKAAMRATIEVKGGDLDDEGNPKWAADFNIVAKAFLSSEAPARFAWEEDEQVRNGVQILDNFYRYILLHDICPEYTNDIQGARQTCEMALVELPAVNRCMERLPGKINTACSIIFGGQAQDLLGGEETWEGLDDGAVMSPQLKKEEARLRFMMCIAAHFGGGSDSQPVQSKMAGQTITKVEEDIGLEVVEITKSDARIKGFYRTIGKGATPTGKLRCKRWISPSFGEDDLPPGIEKPAIKEYEFFVEEDILRDCFVGMKIECTVRTLSEGMQYMDEILTVKCSFYTVLANELLGKWREPRWIAREEQRQRIARQQAMGAPGTQPDDWFQRKLAEAEAQGDEGEGDEEGDDNDSNDTDDNSSLAES